METIVHPRVTILAGLLTIGLMTTAAPDGGSESMTVVKVDGSSTVFPITEAVAEEFQKALSTHLLTAIASDAACDISAYWTVFLRSSHWS